MTDGSRSQFIGPLHESLVELHLSFEVWNTRPVFVVPLETLRGFCHRYWLPFEDPEEIRLKSYLWKGRRTSGPLEKCLPHAGPE